MLSDLGRSRHSPSPVSARHRIRNTLDSQQNHRRHQLPPGGRGNFSVSVVNSALLQRRACVPCIPLVALLACASLNQSWEKHAVVSQYYPLPCYTALRPFCPHEGKLWETVLLSSLIMFHLLHVGHVNWYIPIEDEYLRSVTKDQLATAATPHDFSPLRCSSHTKFGHNSKTRRTVESNRTDREGREGSVKEIVLQAW